MHISVFGLGYVGTVTAACFAEVGHHVVGVDPNSTKTELVATGRSPIVEPGVGELLAAAHAADRLSATPSCDEAVDRTTLSIVCVGTPSRPNGRLDLSYLQRVCEEIGRAIRNKTQRHTIVIRSTVLPGTMAAVVVPALESESGKIVGNDFGLAHNPEFLREGSAVADFRNPPKTVFGAFDEQTSALLASLYAHVRAPTFSTSPETAELLKYADNTWHALKVGFANEIGRISKAVGIDSREVMRIFCEDRYLNISTAYLRPGFAFGGSCLPKDLRAVAYHARANDVVVPILDSILDSNARHIDEAFRLVTSSPGRRIGVLGFSFKAETDDLRESPVVDLIERLLGKGYELAIYDRNVSIARLMGANRQYILELIPHISNLMVETVDEVVDHADIIIIGNGAGEFQDILARTRPDQRVIDLVGILERRSGDGYEGICW